MRAVSDEIAQLLAWRVGQGCRRWLHVGAESRQDGGIDPVRLGELAGTLGELAHAGGIDDRGRHALGIEGLDERAFEPARGLHDHATHILALETARQRCAAVGVVGDPNRGSDRRRDVQVLLSHIHTDPCA